LTDATSRSTQESGLADKEEKIEKEEKKLAGEKTESKKVRES
jgi:hypothetical protein